MKPTGVYTGHTEENFYGDLGFERGWMKGRMIKGLGGWRGWDMEWLL